MSALHERRNGDVRLKGGYVFVRCGTLLGPLRRFRHVLSDVNSVEKLPKGRRIRVLVKGEDHFPAKLDEKRTRPKGCDKKGDMVAEREACLLQASGFSPFKLSNRPHRKRKCLLPYCWRWWQWWRRRRAWGQMETFVCFYISLK